MSRLVTLFGACIPLIVLLIIMVGVSCSGSECRVKYESLRDSAIITGDVVRVVGGAESITEFVDSCDPERWNVADIAWMLSSTDMHDRASEWYRKAYDNDVLVKGRYDFLNWALVEVDRSDYESAHEIIMKQFDDFGMSMREGVCEVPRHRAVMWAAIIKLKIGDALGIDGLRSALQWCEDANFVIEEALTYYAGGDCPAESIPPELHSLIWREVDIFHSNLLVETQDECKE